VTDGTGARVLRSLTDPRGGRPLPWAVAPLRDAGRVLEIGPGLLRDELDSRWCLAGVDGLVTAEAPGPAAAIDDFPLPLPLPTNGVDAVCLLLVLARVGPVDALFAEVRRVLRPAGTLVVVAPSVTLRSVADLRLVRTLRPVRRGTWPNRAGLDGVGWLLAAADFAVMGDDRVPFALPLPDPAAAVNAVTDLQAAGVWPALDPDVADALAYDLAGHAGPGRMLPVPLRRSVARR
jgi:SAM-dependent methyltransferase